MEEAEAKELFKRQRFPKYGNSITADGVLDNVNIDLMDMSKVSTKNKNYNFGLVWIDIYSRRAYVIPIKNKNSTTVYESLKKLPKPKTFISDSGSEFKGAVKQWMNKHDIEHFTVELEDHNSLGIIDRFIRTVRDKLNIIWATNGDFNWIDYIEAVVDKYNKTKHSTTGSAPIDIFEGRAKNLQVIHRDPTINKFEPGTKVRKELKKNLFEKGGTQYSRKIYTVSKRKGYKLVLSDGSIVGPRKLLITKYENKDEVEPHTELKKLVKEKTVKTVLLRVIRLTLLVYILRLETVALCWIRYLYFALVRYG